ncbi:hypothetical protein [Castellaniella sp.]|uniref:hypothetical protein n=1 Tax=Castellaniella sp. TaxID=1955812 RepID=UPI002AFEA02C|nr:hypothetical protein [Castellaniella sp.]
MKKLIAINLLGGSATEAAKAIGVTPQAISQWPDVLSRQTADRVIAALAKRDPKKWPAVWAEISKEPTNA